MTHALIVVCSPAVTDSSGSRAQLLVILPAALLCLVVALAGCGDKLPALPALSPKTAPAPQQPAAGVQTSFRDCAQFFAAGSPPIVPQAQLLRELCYDAFAILENHPTPQAT